VTKPGRPVVTKFCRGCGKRWAQGRGFCRVCERILELAATLGICDGCRAKLFEAAREIEPRPVFAPRPVITSAAVERAPLPVDSGVLRRCEALDIFNTRRRCTQPDGHTGEHAFRALNAKADGR
jgi:hypothetical protein